ncbi:hypothetical protein [Caballeronia pedi]|uniref:hypothetical protein n=1 Tax=Caballeronia pedi TaxID=1777141 RepID=UPI001178AAB0|nr:hypothetical protein [Caballeronia pedi]
MSKPNVIGLMLGVKLVSDEVTPQLCLTVLVDTKLPMSELSPEAKLPVRLTLEDKKRVPVDVLEMQPLRRQAAAFPRQGTLGLSDTVQTGTLSALSVSPGGVFGITCAHVLKGKDNDTATPTPVGAWSPSLNRYLQVGTSLFSVSGPGAGVRGSFGFLDAGLFSIQHPELLYAAKHAQPLALARSLNLKTALTGIGAVKGVRSGQVIGLEQSVYGVLCDVVIRVDVPGTFRGDSGMLWRNDRGEATAIHAMGTDAPPGVGSALTGAMLVRRATTALGVTLIDAPI